MKSRKTLLIIFLVVISVIGFTAIQDDNIFDGNQLVKGNEFSSDIKTITVSIIDGVGSGDNG